MMPRSPTRPELLPEEPVLTLAGHLDELRRRLGISLLAWLLATAGCGTQAAWLLAWLRRPVADLLPAFAFFSPTEPLVAYVKVSVLAGALLALPVVLWQLWGFLQGGLRPTERRLGGVFIAWGTLQFAAGVLFAYAILGPVSLRFLLGVGRTTMVPVLSVDRYLAFYTGLMWWCGVTFEVPVVIALLAKAGIVTAEWLRQQRPLAIVGLLILAAIVTPTTDPVNLLLLALPLLALYELSILLARWLGAGRRAARR